MATDLETRPASSKTESQLKRQFAALCARIHRIDLLAHLLALALAIVAYALLMAAFDWFVGNSTVDAVVAFRWIAYCTFLAIALFVCVRTVTCFFRKVNPYYVAHQLEKTTPDAKNALINWLDLNDEDLPSAFRKNLSASAVEQIDEGDVDQIVRPTKNWVLTSIIAITLIGLAVLFVLAPADFLSSMRRAFVPFYAPAPSARTLITLMQPDGGDVEVNPTQAVTFAAKIEGRVPAVNRPDAPKLQYRYQDNEDWQAIPLSAEAGGLWATTLQGGQLRTGLTYKLSAGDAETLEHSVRVRAAAHVKKFEVTYQHRPYRKLPKASTYFPNPLAAKPHLHGPRGSDVELVIRTSRPVKSAAIEFVAKNVKKELPVELRSGDAHTAVCRFTLERSGKFRVTYQAVDGEKSTDREFYPIDVTDDPLPTVALTRPGKDIELPYNSSFVVEGRAAAGFGVRRLLLQFRVVNDPTKIAPLPYPRDKTFQHDDGSLPGEVEYMDFVALDKLMDERGAVYLPRADSVIEYWLEVIDGSDYPNAGGAIGKSAVYKLKLLSAPVDPKEEQIRRKQALDQKGKHEKQQQQKQDQEKKSGNGNKGDGASDPQKQHDQAKSEANKSKQQMEKSLQEQRDQGGARGADPDNAKSKPGPQGSPDAPEPEVKEQPMTPPEDAGNSKGGGGPSGQPRDGGDPQPKVDGTKDGPASAKGIEQQGPELSQKAGDAKTEPPPGAQSKGGGSNDAGASKDEPTKGAGQVRDDGPKRGDPKNPEWDRIAKDVEKLPGDGPESEAAAKDLAEIGKNADDPRKQDIAKEALARNGRDPSTGKKTKTPFGSVGKSPGVWDDIKTAAANREFAARIGQMQLDDWKKVVTPDLLKKKGLTQADWDRYVKSMQSYDAAVRDLNTQMLRKALRELTGSRTPIDSKINAVETIGRGSGVPIGNAPSPPELRDAQRKFTSPP